MGQNRNRDKREAVRETENRDLTKMRDPYRKGDRQIYCTGQNETESQKVKVRNTDRKESERDRKTDIIMSKKARKRKRRRKRDGERRRDRQRYLRQNPVCTV